jgi:hypothetical protein
MAAFVTNLGQIMYTDVPEKKIRGHAVDVSASDVAGSLDYTATSKSAFMQSYAACAWYAAVRVQDVPQFRPPEFQLLAKVDRTHVGTKAAAFYLNRKEQTLRMWACYENGPIRAVRVNKRLAWPVEQIRNLLTNGS